MRKQIRRINDNIAKAPTPFLCISSSATHEFPLKLSGFYFSWQLPPYHRMTQTLTFINIPYLENTCFLEIKCYDLAHLHCTISFSSPAPCGSLLLTIPHYYFIIPCCSFVGYFIWGFCCEIISNNRKLAEIWKTISVYPKHRFHK